MQSRSCAPLHSCQDSGGTKFLMDSLVSVRRWRSVSLPGVTETELCYFTLPVTTMRTPGRIDTAWRWTKPQARLSSFLSNLPLRLPPHHRWRARLDLTVPH